MPKVGRKHFAYTPAGEAAAERASKKTGKKVVRRKKKGFVPFTAADAAPKRRIKRKGGY